MNNKTVFKIAFISLVIFVLVATYFWYLYFKEYESSTTKEYVRYEFINNGGINYINAVPNDLEGNIPTYYFRIKNNISEDIKYEIFLERVSPSDINDGCSEDMLFKESELRYELKLDNRVIKNGLLSTINNNILDNNKVLANSINDYSLRIWLDDNYKGDLAKHYHYVVNVREIK